MNFQPILHLLKLYEQTKSSIDHVKPTFYTKQGLMFEVSDWMILTESQHFNPKPLTLKDTNQPIKKLFH